MAPVTLSDIQAARRRTAADVRRTPVVPSDWLSDASGGTVLLKLESLQVTNSFKPRGALNAAMQVVAAHGRSVTIVTASAGNHGRAIAWAAERLGLEAIVFTPRTAPETKTRAIQRHGADLRAIAENYEEAERLAQQHARDTGDAFISPYNHPDVIAGAGTIGLELMEDIPGLQAVLVPIGGGGLISGVATAIKALDAWCRSDRRRSRRVVGLLSGARRRSHRGHHGRRNDCGRPGRKRGSGDDHVACHPRSRRSHRGRARRRAA